MNHQSLRIISTCCHQRHRYYGCASVEETHSQELQMLVECEIPHPLHDYMPFSRMSNRMKHDFFCKDGSISGLQCSSFWFDRRDDSNSATGVKHYPSLIWFENFYCSQQVQRLLRICKTSYHNQRQ